MKKMLITTYVDFWRGGAGHRTRLTALINFLRKRINITVVYIGVCEIGDEQALAELFPTLDFYFLDKEKELSIDQYIYQFSNFIAKHYFDIALLEYIEMYLLLPYFPASTLKILDTHDILSDKIESFQKYQLPYSRLMVNFSQEMDIYKAFDIIIMISKKDYEKVVDIIGVEKTLLIPHPVSLVKSKVRNSVKNIGYVASNYIPNVEAIEWFLCKVWPLVQKTEVKLHIYGHVSDLLSAENYVFDNVVLHGFTQNLEIAYSTFDIIINPVRCGSGLKIKNVEALGYGIPLVTTSHGASGIEDASPAAIRIADTPEQFALALHELIDNYTLRVKIAAEAHAYAVSHFSENECFQPLIQFLL